MYFKCRADCSMISTLPDSCPTLKLTQTMLTDKFLCLRTQCRAGAPLRVGLIPQPNLKLNPSSVRWRTGAPQALARRSAIRGVARARATVACFPVAPLEHHAAGG